MQKIKRLTLQMVENEFPAMDIAEQDLCIGKIKFTYNGSGWTKDVSDGNYTTAHIVVQGSSGTFSMGYQEFMYIDSGGYFDVNSVRPLFEFLASKSNNEWSLSILNNGTARLHSDHNEKTVVQFITSNTKTVIHSHTNNYEGVPSPEDKNAVIGNAGTTFMLYYNKKYRPYDQYGFYGDWY